jgi:SAM-dependent methyltransferase
MLRVAQARSMAVAWLQGDSARPPFQSSSFDYITNQLSYHHTQDKAAMIGEVYRLLKPGGRFVLTNIDPWSMAGWAIYRFFPAAQERDHQDCWPATELVARLEDAGFSNIQGRRDHQSPRVTLRECLEYASRRHRTSQLIVISDQDYEAGIARIAQAIEQAGGDFVVDSELCFITIQGDKQQPS